MESASNDKSSGTDVSVNEQLDATRYWMLVCATVAQLATVIITWELWHARHDPPNLPLIDVPQISFGIWMVFSLLLVLFKPRTGFWVHVIIITAASLFDQFRMQPQFLALVLLMWAAIYETGTRIGRWFLAALWIWAGIHKLLSPHWFAHAGHWMLTAMQFDDTFANQWHTQYAMVVGLSEIAVGLAAIIRPRLAAYLGAAMHLSIFFLLIYIDWNFSVLPWNLATAIVGAWMLLNVSQSDTESRHRWIEFVAAGVFFVAPVGFFWGMLDHGYANVLYSDFVPRALITSKESLREVSGWHPIHVPFPYERRTHRQFFESLAGEGDKLHIHDPRPALEDLYFVMRDGQAVRISKEDFFSDVDDSVAGIAIDDRHARFWLRRRGTIKRRWYRDIERTDRRRSDSLVSYAYQMNPETYSVETLKLLTGLPNLEQLQLSGCPVIDSDLAVLSGLTNLSGLGLSNTSVTDEGLRHLEKLPKIRILEVENTRVSPDGLKRLQKSLGF